MTIHSPSGTRTSDVQSRSPTVALSLSGVGATAVEEVIRRRDNGSERLFSARCECGIELVRSRQGARRGEVKSWPGAAA